MDRVAHDSGAEFLGTTEDLRTHWEPDRSPSCSGNVNASCVCQRWSWVSVRAGRRPGSIARYCLSSPMCDSGLGRVLGILPLPALDTAGLAPRRVPKPLSKVVGFRNEWETEGPPSFSPLRSRMLILGASGKFGLIPFFKKYIACHCWCCRAPGVAALSWGMAPLSSMQHHALVRDGARCSRGAGAPGGGGQGLGAAGSVPPAGGSTAGISIERHYRSTPTTILMGPGAGFDLKGFMGKYFK